MYFISPNSYFPNKLYHKTMNISTERKNVPTTVSGCRGRMSARKTSLVLVDKRGFFSGSGEWIRTADTPGMKTPKIG